MIWDSREAARWDGDRRVGINSPVMVMEDAHKYVSTESARKRRKQASRYWSLSTCLAETSLHVSANITLCLSCQVAALAGTNEALGFWRISDNS